MQRIEELPASNWLPLGTGADVLHVVDPYLIWASVVDGDGVKLGVVPNGKAATARVLIEYKNGDKRAYTPRNWRLPYLGKILANLSDWQKFPKDLRNDGTLITRIELASALAVESADHDDACETVRLQSDAGPTSETVTGNVIGIIDFGCPFLHRAYRDDFGCTRLKYFWDQNPKFHFDPDARSDRVGDGLGAVWGGKPFQRLGEYVNEYLQKTKSQGLGTFDLSQFDGEFRVDLHKGTLGLLSTDSGVAQDVNNWSYRLTQVEQEHGHSGVAVQVWRDGLATTPKWRAPADPLDGLGVSDSRFTYGRELRPADLKVLSTQAPPAWALSQYEAMDYSDVQSASSHGAHIMSVAAGWPNLLAETQLAPRDAAADAKLIFVQLPATTVADTGGNSLGAYVLNALEYIAARSAASAKVVVNLSYGSYAGPHDGSSLIEKALDWFVTKENEQRREANGSFDLVIAAGNGFQAACHARAHVGAELEQIPFNVMPDDETWTFIEVWYRGDPKMKVGLQPPDGHVSLDMVEQDHVAAFDEAGAKLCVIVHTANASSSNSKDGEVINSMALIAIAPTRRRDGSSRPAPYGRWTLLLQSGSEKETQVDAWIERDDPILEPTFARRQATFIVDSQAYEARDQDFASNRQINPSMATKQGTMNSIATGKNANVHVVGSKVLSTEDLSPYSPAGDISPGHCPSPTQLECADELTILAGRLGYGNHDSVVVRKSGTSVAAAMFTRSKLNDLARAAAKTSNAQPDAAASRQAGPNAPAEADSLKIARGLRNQ